MNICFLTKTRSLCSKMCLTPLETNGEKTAASCHVPFIAVILQSGVTNCPANHYKENDSMTGKTEKTLFLCF